jgi:hypothetical protein
MCVRQTIRNPEADMRIRLVHFIILRVVSFEKGGGVCVCVCVCVWCVCACMCVYVCMYVCVCVCD